VRRIQRLGRRVSLRSFHVALQTHPSLLPSFQSLVPLVQPTDARSSSTELYSRDSLKSSKRISNPGCFSTNSQLLIAPLLPYLSKTAAPTVFGISGYSGAGTSTGSKPKIAPESLAGGVKPYSLTDHIHEREAGYHLGRLSQPPLDDFTIAFVPSVAPWFQGIISTVSAPLEKEMRASEIRALFDEAYGGEKLVNVQSEVPEIKDAAGQHGVRIGGFQVHSSGKRVVAVVSAVFWRESRETDEVGVR
jgi:N-acetyl-gamma-glutamyl-phosphate reductase/acetylglutamate kinase